MHNDDLKLMMMEQKVSVVDGSTPFYRHQAFLILLQMVDKLPDR